MTEQVPNPSNPNPAAPAPVEPAKPAPVVDTPNPAPTPSPAAPTPEVKADAFKADTGSQQLDVALGFFVNHLGLSAESPEVLEFQRTGNVDYLKGHAAQKGIAAELLEPYLALGIGGRSELTKAAEAKQAELRTELEGYSGGAEKFQQTLDFVKATADEATIDKFDAILDQGGVGAEALLFFIQHKMHQHAGTSVQGKDAVQPNAAAHAPVQATTYPDRASWRRAQGELISRFGSEYQNTPEGKALLAAFPG
ncbi:hypothetical protein [Stenotrophomonas phage TS-10]|uniref:Uncharacterized protein n=1 Tax=Stenotrophomonas phage TS-10 TaxID=2886106 RepID=A0AAE8Y9H4_9CAUD|nr:hypothetical protein [Stenotrophomonas phage TS-10]